MRVGSIRIVFEVAKLFFITLFSAAPFPISFSFIIKENIGTTRLAKIYTQKRVGETQNKKKTELSITLPKHV